MARRVTPVAEKHCEVCAIDLAIEVRIACSGEALGGVVDDSPVWAANPATARRCLTPYITITHFDQSVGPGPKNLKLGNPIPHNRRCGLCKSCGSNR